MVFLWVIPNYYASHLYGNRYRCFSFPLDYYPLIIDYCSVTDQLLTERRARFKKLYKKLREIYPVEPESFLAFVTPWQLLVAVILSARCTDEQVNKVTPVLFSKYPDADSLATAPLSVIEELVHSTGFYRQKAKAIQGAAQAVVRDFAGVTPQAMEDLIQLPGVGRKTANVVRYFVWGVATGVVVDTHIKRFAIRYDLTDHAQPEKIEGDLMDVVPEKEWGNVAYYILRYGRGIAPAKKYDTSTDPLVAIYPPAGKIFRV
ncbi:MAG: endonuclease-3 [Planctomycetota bacterium]